MHFYALSYSELMAVPVKTFWLMNANIDRIQAQKDMRALTVAVCGQGGGEAASEHRERLVVEIGTTVKLKYHPVFDAERDEEGFAALRAMANQM